jgi:DNA mismatch repair protein MutL
MGFRGEALPSIAAVSELALTTRAASSTDGAGYRLEVAGGIAGEARAVSSPIGTTVEVRRLLQNVPARLKFLKSEATESAHVAEAVVRLALAHPHVHFRLRSQGRLAIDLPPHKTGLERARATVGRSARASSSGARLHLCVHEESGAHVEAYLGSPAESTNTSRATYPFVNRRFVRDRGLLQAIVMGYGELLERGRYPLAVVHVTVPGEGVDVNVHPQKLEVRFAHAQDVYAAVRHAIAQAVARAPWLAEPPGAQVAVYSLPPLPRTSAREPEASYGYADHRKRVAEALKLFAPAPELPLAPPPPVPKYLLDREAAEARAAEPERFFSSLHYLGQLDHTYLVCAAPGELVLIDQHAAHERVAFQRLREAHAKRQVRTQRLLLPAFVELDDTLRAAAAEHAGVLAQLGFEIAAPEPGARGVEVRALPEPLASASPAEVLAEVLGELASREATTVVAAELDHVLATMACHSVVRAGDVLSEREVRALLESMDGVDYRAHCPHGRPVLLRLSIGELERRFGRT